jgi:hypothetical protein
VNISCERLVTTASVAHDHFSVIRHSRFVIL